MIENVKTKIKKNVGIKHKFIFNGVRNQSEEFEGVINNTYNKVFTILIDGCILKSFSYSDVLTNNLEIIDL